jgi:hypothetical protein
MNSQYDDLVNTAKELRDGLFNLRQKLNQKRKHHRRIARRDLATRDLCKLDDILLRALTDDLASLELAVGLGDYGCLKNTVDNIREGMEEMATALRAGLAAGPRNKETLPPNVVRF